jgi:Zn-dependent protease
LNDSGYEERTAALAPGEVGQILVAWIVLSLAISISYLGGLFEGTGDAAGIAAAFIATATAFVFHEMGHKFVAMRFGYVAHFRVWAWGLALTLITAVVSQGTFMFGAPGAVYIAPAVAGGYYAYGRYSDGLRSQEHDSVLISAAGPGTNLAFAILFLALLIFGPASGFVQTVASYGFSLNVGLGAFNMLPIPPMDGYKIFRGSIPRALMIALPLWGMFLLLLLG